MRRLLVSTLPKQQGPTRGANTFYTAYRAARAECGLVTRPECTKLTGLKSHQISIVANANILGAPKEGFRGDLFDEQAAMHLRRVLDKAMPLTAAAAKLELTPLATEQLLASHMLRRPEHQVFSLLYTEPYVDTSSVAALQAEIEDACPVIADGSDLIPLSVIMRSIGSGAKPWSDLLKMVLAGGMKCVRRVDATGVPSLLLPVRSASNLLHCGFATSPVPVDRESLTEIEASEYLNIGWRGLQSLVDHGRLQPDSAKASRQIPTAQVVDLGQRYISSHEIAARQLRRRPRSARAEMNRIGQPPVIGDFFWDRKAVAASYLV